MKHCQSTFCRKKVIMDTLEPFGFQRTDRGYIYKRTLTESGFEMSVTVDADGEVYTAVVDPSCNEPYTLHLADGATGSFVGAVRAEYEKCLAEISQHCFAPDVFKSAQARELIEYVRQTHHDELEFLWDKFPDNAIWRRKDNRKWYAALLTVSKQKLGLKSDAVVEILDLREAPETIEALIDGKKYYSGWHMNKKSWYTMILDGSVSTGELFQRLETSYAMAAGKN